MERSPVDRHDTIIMWALAKLDVAAFVAASAVVTGAALFMLTLFLVVKGINRLRAKEDEPKKAPEAPLDVKLLTEIRDLLARRSA